MSKKAQLNAVNRIVAKHISDFLAFTLEALTEYFPSNGNYITTA